MVRCVMYLSVGTVFIWNARVTSNILALNPNANNMDLGSDASNNDHCDATVYNFSYILIIFFNVVSLSSIAIWLASIISGM